MDSEATYPPRVTLFGIDIDPWTMEQTVRRAGELVEGGKFAHLIGVNADKVLQIKDSTEMQTYIRRCEVVNADGASMLVAARRLGVVIPERVAGIDLMGELCSLCASRGWRVYLLGARPDVARRACVALEARYPGLDVCGVRDGYFGEGEFDSVASDVAAASPRVVFVGITSPKKERFIERARALGISGVFVGVGGSFDVVSGDIPRAPAWMQRARLEWLFRMAQEPRRLAGRYLVGNARFLLLTERERRAMRGRGRP